jgi:hypothetical protein
VGTPTKQFPFIRQSYGDLSASQSALCPATATSIGLRPASWQCIRNGHPERQESVWTEAATYTVNFNVIISLHKKPQGTASINFFSAEPRLLLPSTVKHHPFFTAAMRPVSSLVQAAHRARYHREHCSVATLHTSGPFKGIRVTDTTVRWSTLQCAWRTLQWVCQTLNPYHFSLHGLLFTVIVCHMTCCLVTEVSYF